MDVVARDVSRQWLAMLCNLRAQPRLGTDALGPSPHHATAVHALK